MTSILERPEVHDVGEVLPSPVMEPPVASTAEGPVYCGLDEILSPRDIEYDPSSDDSVDETRQRSWITVYEHDEKLGDYLLFAYEHQRLLDLTRSERARERAMQAVHVAKTAGQVAVAAAVFSPLNEVTRSVMFAASYAHSHNPAVGALALGVSTFALEVVGGSAAARAIATGHGEQVSRYFNKRLSRVTDQKLSPITKAISVLAFGTVFGMAVEQAEDPTRTVEQNKRYAVRTAAWLGAALGSVGAAGSETLNGVLSKPEVAAPLAGAVVAFEAVRRVARGVARRLRYPKAVANPETETWQDSDQYATYHLVTDAAELKKAAEMEQAVWDEKEYGKLDEEGYTEHIEKSRTFGGFDQDGNCVGVNRMFGGTEGLLPPFLLNMPFYDETERVALGEKAQQGELEEFGTAAVVPELRRKGVNDHLWRQAFRDGAARGIKYWGMIIEPDRAERMNRKYGFTFKQLGPVKNYQGGDCAAFVMERDELLSNMQRKKPLVHWWFTRKSLKP